MEAEKEKLANEIAEFYSGTITRIYSYQKKDRELGIKLLELLKAGTTKLLRSIKNQTETFQEWDSTSKEEGLFPKTEGK